MATFEDLYEVFNFNKPFHDEVEFDDLEIFDNDPESADGDSNEVLQLELDPVQFVSAKFYSFNRELGEYLIRCLRIDVEAKPATIMMLDPNFVREEEASVDAIHKSILKKWKHYENGFGVHTVESGEDRLFNRNEKYSQLSILYFDEWSSIVKKAHCIGDLHQPFKLTLASISKEKWLIGAHVSGIPKPYIEEFVKCCETCKHGQRKSKKSVSSKGKERSFFQYNEHHTMLLVEKDEFIKNVLDLHSVHLKLIKVYKILRPYGAKVSIYGCHRRRKFRGKDLDPNDTSEKARQHSSARSVDCKFRLKIVESHEEGSNVEVFINIGHTNHVPGTKTDLYFLPVHQTAVDNCSEMLTNLNNIQLALAHSKRCESILREKAPFHEQKIYRFFLDPKEASNLSYRLQLQGRCNEDDYEMVQETIPKWIENKQVIFYQAYSPQHEDLTKRPFVLVMQTTEMLERAKSITPNASWAIDSTFKTNQWGMSLYAGVCPNARGLGMPIFLMLCTVDKESGHEGLALWITMKVVFENMGNIRPNAIVIDKAKIELNAITKAIKEDIWCWKNQEIGGTQIKCKMLLCWFHAKKAWVESLLSKVTEERRNNLYQAMCSMLESATEEEFNEAYSKFKISYATDENVLRYVEMGWAGDNCPWKYMWPRFGQMFKHAHVNTTNLVERMWQHVKYTLLDGKVNHRLDELVLAIIGQPRTGQRFGGLTLVEHYDDVHWLSESQKYSLRGVDQSRTAKLQQAKKIVQRYKSNPSSNLEIVDICHMEFSMRSQTHSYKWYLVSLSREWCECNDHGPICKHMMAMKIIVDEDYQHLQALLPSVYEQQGFINKFEEDIQQEISAIRLAEIEDEENDETEVHDKLIVERDSEIDTFISKFQETTSTLMITEKLKGLSLEQYQTVKEATQSFLAVLQNTMQPQYRPSQISMPRAGGSIATIQAHVTETRLGHGSQKKKWKLIFTGEEEILNVEEPKLSSPRPGGGKKTWRKELVQKKRTRVKLPKLCKNACFNCGDLNIFFEGVTTIDCKNCGHIMTQIDNRHEGDVEECGDDQDLDLFFKELDIY